MAEVPTLKRIGCLVTVQALLNIREDTSTASAWKLLQLLQTDSYTGVYSCLCLRFSFVVPGIAHLTFQITSGLFHFKTTFAAVSGSVLLQIVETFPDRVTDAVLLSLVPPHVKQLTLENCTLLTPSGLELLLKR